MRLVWAMGLAAGAVFGAVGSAEATVRIDIDLATQRMHVTSNSGAAYDWPISSGRPGHGTPRGTFAPQRMYPIVYSAKYNNAPMPHSIFFSGAYAIHATNAVGHLGHVASHGCVRLAPGNAAMLYDLVKSEGAVIHIGGSSMAVAHNPHKAGHRLAMAQRKRMQEEAALAYAPHPRHHRSLRQWAKNPLGTN